MSNKNLVQIIAELSDEQLEIAFHEIHNYYNGSTIPDNSLLRNVIESFDTVGTMQPTSAGIQAMFLYEMGKRKYL